MPGDEDVIFSFDPSLGLRIEVIDTFIRDGQLRVRCRVSGPGYEHQGGPGTGHHDHDPGPGGKSGPG